MPRIFNFSAGPAVLPESVLAEAATEMLNYRGCGMSVMEMSHRGKVFQEIIEEAEETLRRLMNIPNNYHVLFLQGGDSLLFSTIFYNLAHTGKADYILTGTWAKKAYQEATILGDTKIVASSEDKNFSYIPDCSDLPIRDDASYLYICENNTIYGTTYAKLPNTKGHILVSDQSSMFLSQPCDIEKYGLIHAGAQKNVGPAGVQIVIVREDLVPADLPEVPTMLRFKTHVDARSLYNTPPAYGIYIVGKVFKWIESEGGLAAMEARNRRKANWLYETLDNSEIFSATVKGKDRSSMNIPFVSKKPELDRQFLAEAETAGLVSLKGHRSVGGMRASLYNAMSDTGVKALCEFIRDFETRHC